MGEAQPPTVVPVPPNLTGKRPSQPPLEGNPWLIGTQRWHRAERAAEQIVAEFRPTAAAERKRVEIIIYLQQLLQRNLDRDVFAYGSVPLRTYLPDGDIDLTVVGASNDDFVKDIASLLEREGKNSSAKFVVKDVRLIDAEVKLVKCIVQNIVVDISVNQIGGLCTLCFLEQVDRVIGKNHLFKESIILIKAWCYYESRTLGAHAGLISTYGLEILVLYIFHVFHRTLDGPLSVLYKFLEYFSTFDWDNYCISLIGPVRISALPEIVAVRPPNCHDLLLRGDFLRYCFKMLSVPVRGGNEFPVKYLNIIDPLKDDNNLGRSVNKANSIRIRSAFDYGVRKLGQILMAPEDNMADELHNFFSNTMTLHGGGRRPDLQDPEALRTGAGAEKTSSITETREPRNSSDENASASNGFSGSQYSREGDVSNLGLDGLKISEASVEASTSEPLDLTGDLNGHLACLRYARWWYPYIFAVTRPPPPPPPLLIAMSAMEQAHHVAHFERNGFHHGGINGGSHPGFLPPNQMLMSRPRFGLKEPNPRCTMTSLPEMALPVNRASNGMVMSPRGSDFLVNRSGGAHVSDGRRRTLSPNASGFIPVPEPGAELVPVRQPMAFREPLHGNTPRTPNRALPAERRHRPRSVSRTHRVVVRSPYHLKDEDFPPLSESSRKAITH